MKRPFATVAGLVDPNLQQFLPVLWFGRIDRAALGGFEDKRPYGGREVGTGGVFAQLRRGNHVPGQGGGCAGGKEEDGNEKRKRKNPEISHGI